MNVKQQVRQFYDEIGWQVVADGMYQNARYEDLRPVAREYIRRCHLRVGRFIKPSGRFLLDAGSGPIQYPEYLTYSQGYTYRVCVDLSIVALQEARKRIADRGLFVVADVANLPFKPGAFDGAVSLHTLHHLPAEDHARAYTEMVRVIAPGASAAIVNGWTESRLMNRARGLISVLERVQNRLTRRGASPQDSVPPEPDSLARVPQKGKPTGTFIQKYDARWLSRTLSGRIPYEIRCWRSVSVRFTRAAIHPRLAGRLWLRLLFLLEDRFPHWFGVNGQYPLIILRKPG